MAKKIGIIIGSILCLWLTGLCFFSVYAFSIRPWAVKREAIVVLTGGTARIPAGISLLEKGMGNHLFISGVHDKVNVRAFLTSKQEVLKNKITLGYEANNTLGNAIETADWLRKNKIRSVLLVTSFYHMPRSLLELREQKPDVTFAPYPIFPDEKGFSFLTSKNAWFLFLEYNKYLAVLARRSLKFLLKGLE